MSRYCSNTNACASSSATRRRADAGRPDHRHLQASPCLIRDRSRRRSRRRAASSASDTQGAPTPSAGSSSTPRSSSKWPGHDRLRFHCNPARPTVDCPTPLGHHRWEYPGAGQRRREGTHHRRGDLGGAQRPGHHRRQRRDLARRHLQPPRARRRPMAGGPSLSRRRRRARDAAVDRTGHVGRCARCGQPVLEARGRREGAGTRVVARLLPGRADAARHEVTQPRRHDGRIITERESYSLRSQPRAARADADPRCLAAGQKLLLDSRSRYRDGFFAITLVRRSGLADPAAVGHRRTAGAGRLDDVLGGGWAMLHYRCGAESARTRGSGRSPLADGHEARRRAAAAIVDTDGALIEWMDSKKAAAIVVTARQIRLRRSSSGHALPTPPAGSNLSAPSNPEWRPLITTALDRTHRHRGGQTDLRRRNRQRPSRCLLHGGGPGASGVSNYSRNIDALAETFPGPRARHARLRSLGQGVDHDDPFGYLADMIRGLIDELGIHRASRRELLWRCRRAAPGAGHPAARRQACVDGPRRYRHHPRAPTAG